MLGGIYTDEKCPQCGRRYVHKEPKGMFCLEHPEQKPSKFKVIFQNITRRFFSYDEARRFLTGLRFKKDEGSFDSRDYKKNNPLGFRALAEKYLEIKIQKVRPSHYRNIRRFMTVAIDAWEQTNVKQIGYAEIEDLLLDQNNLSDKTRANMCSALHDFWTWLKKRRIIQLHQMPEFPEVKYELGWRKTISKEIQGTILDEIHRISWGINPKIYMGIKWLCTYISIRPGELSKIKEGEIDLDQGYFFFPHPKEKKPKLVPLLDEDVEWIKSLPRGLPHLYFFRHFGGIKGTRPGQPFGEKYIYKWWIKACVNLGIEDVDLYGGTRHSSARALRLYRTPEEIKRATMHSTNKAFERYFQLEAEDLRNIYQDSCHPNSADKKLTRKNKVFEKAKVLKFKE